MTLYSKNIVIFTIFKYQKLHVIISIKKIQTSKINRHALQQLLDN